MKVSFFHSVATKISYRFMLLLTVAVLLLSVIYSFLLKQFVRQEQASDLENSCTEIKTKLANGSQDFSIPYFITYAVYYADRKNPIFTNDPFLPHLKLTNGKAVNLIQKDYFIDGDLNIFYYAESTTIKGVQYQIQTAMNMDTDSAKLLLRGIPVTLALICIPVLMLSFLVSLFMTRNTIKPVILMTEQAKRIGSENLDEKLPVKHTEATLDENDELAETFNDLFARLKTDFDRERAFTSDVSHELRTPVSVILGQSRLLMRWGKDDPAQTEKSLNIIIKEAHSMDSTIKNLLQMSRLESGRQSPVKEKFTLQTLFTQLSDETLSYEENAEINIDCDDNLQMTSDRELLHQTLTIIISNSIKFCKAVNTQPKITLIAKTDEKNKVLTISTSDNGPGISEEILPHIFERFYRGDSSHNRAAGGSGLGLSIAQVIIHVLGGTISASNIDSGGACISLTFSAQAAGLSMLQKRR